MQIKEMSNTTDRNLRNIVNFRRVCNPEDNVFKLLRPSSSNNSITDKPILFKSDIGEFPKNCGTVCLNFDRTTFTAAVHVSVVCGQ